MKSKVSELGVFAIGLGLLITGLIVYYDRIAKPADRMPLEKLALFCIPPAIVVLAGILTLAARSLTAVRISLWVLTLSLVVDALLVLNPVKWLISALCLALIWKTAKEAIEEIQAQVPDPQSDG